MSDLERAGSVERFRRNEIKSVEEFEQFFNAFLNEMQASFSSKKDIDTVLKTMRSRFTGLLIDLKGNKIFEHGFYVLPSISDISVNKTLVLELVDGASGAKTTFLEFMFENVERDELEPTRDQTWLHTQPFTEAQGFLRAIRFMKEIK